MTPDDLVVTGVRTWSHTASPRSTWVMVQVTAGDVVGLGELSDGGHASRLERAARSVVGAVTGHPVGAARAAVRDLLTARREAEHDIDEALLWSTVLGGLESAFADLEARAQGIALSASLGLGGPRPVRVYANLNRRWGGESADVVCDEARRAVSEGYAAVKIAPFSWASHQGSRRSLVARALTLTRRVRDAVPAGTALMVDCHQLVPADLVGEVLRGLAPCDPLWVEDLVDVHDAAALRAAALQTELPLAAGEHVWDPALARKACASGALTYWLVDPKHAGGPDGTARMAEAADGTCLTFHNPSGPVGTAHAAHLAALGGQDTWLEVAFGEADRAAYLDPPERLVDGRWQPATGSGIGAVPARLVSVGEPLAWGRW